MVLFLVASTLYVLAIIVHVTMLVHSVLSKIPVQQNKWLVFLLLCGILLNLCVWADICEIQIKTIQMLCMLLHIFWGAVVFLLLKPYLFPKAQHFTSFRVLITPIFVAFFYLGFHIWYKMNANTFLAFHGEAIKRTDIAQLFVYFSICYGYASLFTLLIWSVSANIENLQVIKQLVILFMLVFVPITPLFFTHNLDLLKYTIPVFSTGFILYLYYMCINLGYFSAIAKVNDNTQALLNAIEQIITFEKLYLNTDISLEKVALMMQVKPYVVSRTLNVHLNTSFPDYMNRLRVEHAITLLNDTNNHHMKIDDIGKVSGFRSKSVFFQNFKQKTGKTPLQYKKLIHNNT